jgi:hypothetical protein
MAEFLGGEPVVLADPGPGPAALARDLAAAAHRLARDLIVFVDVGGDAIAAGHEPGLASPLCDAVLLAAARLIAEVPVAGAVFGPGCDGELTQAEVLGRIAGIAAAGGWLGAWGIAPEHLDRLEEAARAIPTEASACALRCARGELGTAEIRGGRRTVELSPLGALTIFFDIAVTVAEPAPLAAAVLDAADLEDANDRLHALGVRTELDLERAPQQGVSHPVAQRSRR